MSFLKVQMRSVRIRLTQERFYKSPTLDIEVFPRFRQTLIPTKPLCIPYSWMKSHFFIVCFKEIFPSTEISLWSWKFWMNRWVLRAGKTIEKWINVNPKHNQSSFHRNTDVWLLCMTDLAIWLRVCSDLTIEKGHFWTLVFEDPNKGVMVMAPEISLNSCVKVRSCKWLIEN